MGPGRGSHDLRTGRSPGPRWEVKSMAAKKSGGDYRSAKTGRYVTEKHGKSNPNTTVKESRKK